ncbi:MAG TPA: helix-turn-helix domain-containing protein [Candidatus Saccharimonadales bacterium]|nr:helix-turn-helix domain-containing protein [Candidatus Saccharimonadales bacterium]
MDISITEMHYPLNFRSSSAKLLGDHLQHRHSVELIGMKRVGISNFLRFFLYHKDIKQQYMPHDGKNLFIPVDLNNLIEREIFPFWRLTFKRIVDTVENSLLDGAIKQKISDLFVSSIQSGDLFLTFDGVRESLVELVKANIYPTLFLLRFDRLSEAVTPEFLNNLQSLLDVTNQKLCYVFTSYRELDALSPKVFSRQAVSSLVSDMYIKPGNVQDMETIFSTISEKYNLSIPVSLKQILIDLSGGHAQYLQLSLIILHELNSKKKLMSEEEVISAIENDERIALQSEELWESLSAEEQEVTRKVSDGRKVTDREKEAAKYLWNTGFVVEERGLVRLFSPLFANFVEKNEKKTTGESAGFEFSKKEHMLFELLKEKPDAVCEREIIVEEVWPEYKEYGVSDWSVDRLVARVRQKLRKQKANYEIVTVRTRGYKLVTK